MDEDWSDVWFEVDYTENCYKINVDEKMNIEEWWGWLEIEVNIH